MKTMKKEMTVFTALFICAVLTFSAAIARAEAVSTSEAWMDWTSLTISGDITWGTKNSQSYVYVSDDTGSDYDSHYDSGWVDTNAFASIGGPVYHAYGDAYTKDTDLYEEVYALANDATTMRAYAEAEAWRRGYFTANSDGTVEFSANYELWQQLLTDGMGEWAYGYAEAGLYLANDAGLDQDMPALENSVQDGDSITNSDDGKLTVSLWFNAGNTGEFQAWVYNNANVEVPEPATVALLGLGALSLLRRKR